MVERPDATPADVYVAALDEIDSDTRYFVVDAQTVWVDSWRAEGLYFVDDRVDDVRVRSDWYVDVHAVETEDIADDEESEYDPYSDPLQSQIPMGDPDD